MMINGAGNGSTTLQDWEDSLKDQMLHHQPSATIELTATPAASTQTDDGEGTGAIGEVLESLESVMIRFNEDGTPLDPRGVTGAETFGNVIGDSPTEIAEDGLKQNERMGFIPNEGVKANLLNNGV